jgi:hypothetical protein
VISLIPEGIVDKRIEQAVVWNHGSDTYLKFSCLAVSKIVGSYSAATAQIAKETNRSVSTIENWAHAAWLYTELRRNKSDTLLVRGLWRELPASHWWQAYDIQNNGYDALHYLTMAAEHNMGGREMMQNYKADMMAGNAPLIFSRAKIAFRGLAHELLKRKELTPKQRAAVQAVIDAFG